MLFGIVTTVVCLALGYPVAYHLARTRSRWKGALYVGILSPLLVGWESVQQARRKLLREILALTKMNWNTTVFANGEPITVGAARVVGDIFNR